MTSIWLESYTKEMREEQDSRVFVKVARPTGPGGENERWAACEVSPTLNVFDNAGDVRAVILIVGKGKGCR